ncbi:MAG: 2OG-Fe(II) oxygenase [Chlamydiae bacterium]|nr:2OG-Fe(II) oxygenase [Chlamydiota bacterium]
MAILNLEAIRTARLEKEPYPYMVIDSVIHKDALSQVVETFPTLSSRGSFPLDAVSGSGHFDLLMKELQQSELRQLIGERFGMNLKESPPMITLRGSTTEKDGSIHVDSKDKLITFLLYLNPNWQSPGGRIRVLYNQDDLFPFAAEVPPEAGRCLIFKVTDNCWHGHTAFNGPRKSIQLNYVVSDQARKWHLRRHRFSAFLKRVFKKQTY